MRGYCFYFVKSSKEEITFKIMSEQTEQVINTSIRDVSNTQRRLPVEVDLSTRDFVFQSVITRKYVTYKLVLTLEREINILDYLNHRWFSKQWEQVTRAKEAIISTLLEPKVLVKLKGVDYHLSNLQEKYNHDTDRVFESYLNSTIANLTEEELHTLDSHHSNINHLLFTLINSIEYDRITHGC